MSEVTNEVKRISRLDENVINKIAAGEIIHRPANALKELLENSLDAGSKHINVLIKDGGLKLLQIQDDGHGINKADLPLVCERFATSKLSKYEDLEQIGTFGFRGEALASISHVAHTTITTKTVSDQCAWRAGYMDGKLIPLKKNGSSDPKPCAGNVGTQITVEDLFFNAPTRRKALSNYGDEYNRILDVMQRYAVHNAGVSLTCKKQGSPKADLQSLTTQKTIDVIQSIYGLNLSNQLLPFSKTNNQYDYSSTGYISNANYNAKKFQFILFINSRCVENANLKKAIQNVYSGYLGKGSHPWCYISLNIKSENVDVNVHPTKREVHFLNEEMIIESLCESIQETLGNANSSRTFYVQTILPSNPTSNALLDEPKPSSQTMKPSTSKTPVNKQVRTDHRVQTLDSFLIPSQPRPAFEDIIPVNKKHKPNDPELIEDEGPEGIEIEPTVIEDAVMQEPNEIRSYSEIELLSILELRKKVMNSSHEGLTTILTNHVFIGCTSNSHALIQSGGKIFMMNFQEISNEFFYQQFLKSFSNFGHININPCIKLYDLLIIALNEADDEWEEDGMMSKEEISNCIVETLISKAEMLNEYFSIDVSSDGELRRIPLVIKGYTPNMSKLPAFLLRLGTDVDWTDELKCFKGVCKELASFYCTEPEVDEDVDDEPFQQMIGQVLFKSIKTYGLVGQKKFIKNGWIVEVVDLPDLYKVFERC